MKPSTSTFPHKARLVAQGFSQIHGIDYNETFSPVIRYDSLRLLLALAASHSLSVYQMDVTTAFLNGNLVEELYMRQPPWFISTDHPQRVCRLHKSLYGLKQAPLCWNHTIDQVLVQANFTRVKSDYGIYVSHSSPPTYVALYVDDLLILSKSLTQIKSVQSLLSSKFQMKDLGPVTTFLGLNIRQTPQSITLSLSSYLTSILQDFGLDTCNPVTTVSTTTEWVSDHDVPLTDPTLFRSMVGKLLFAANTARPDITFTVAKLSRYLKQPSQNHLTIAKHVLRYLKGTIDDGITYTRTSSVELKGFCDADWGGILEDRTSTTGYIFMLANGPISWKSKKQNSIATSTTEAEYMAMSDAVKELLWLKQLMKELSVLGSYVPILFGDNTSSISLAKHPTQHQRTKHIDIRYHFIRDHILKGDLQIEYVDSQSNIADLLTKQLVREKLNSLKKKMHLAKI
ncbi:Polyprotein (gag/pol) of Ty/Copia retrotransposon [Ogataea parapolymorpha DL-1]|uniref:Polyprotein (Gag/pol) of Ty/Copia retrotransposon n=2 Tax=Ogataea TaxID=461281 RepID=W1QLJ8_OGAPD|nr:Polyprotein (gag/pol) of Ty/Copia retrotransposon [Ogataea parapolymorpha DL-1]ESX02669.1 Polyprotein (gag/pol) of Ty/Copia retrotransposon [Ogataea parapolymorpha DL-1]